MLRKQSNVTAYVRNTLSGCKRRSPNLGHLFHRLKIDHCVKELKAKLPSLVPPKRGQPKATFQYVEFVYKDLLDERFLEKQALESMHNRL
jgi:hypothetical protein